MSKLEARERERDRSVSVNEIQKEFDIEGNKMALGMDGVQIVEIGLMKCVEITFD